MSSAPVNGAEVAYGIPPRDIPHGQIATSPEKVTEPSAEELVTAIFHLWSPPSAQSASVLLAGVIAPASAPVMPFCALSGMESAENKRAAKAITNRRGGDDFGHGVSLRQRIQGPEKRDRLQGLARGIWFKRRGFARLEPGSIWTILRAFGKVKEKRYSHPLVLAIRAASTRLLAPSLLMASDR